LPHTPFPKKKNEKVYPTYDCACPFVDSLEGVTHALRTSEYRDRAPQFAAVLKMCQAVWAATAPLPDVAIWDYSRLAFSGTVMSKRKLLWCVEAGVVEGWDDPRVPTVRGVIRRGLQVPALRAFILAQGASRAVTLQDMDKLWAANRAAVDPLARRHTAIREGAAGSAPRVRLALSGGPATPESVDLPAHKKNPALGTKVQTRAGCVWLEQADAAALAPGGEEVTLMDWGNAVIESVERDPASGVITAASGRLHLEGSPKTTRLKLTWLPADAAAPLTPLTLVEYGDLLSKKKLEEGEDVADFVNPASKTVGAALGDAGLASLPAGALVQLERVGYYRVDVPGDAPTLIRIPDGKKGAGGEAAATAGKEAGAK
jgi:glutamyl-tRNA synthetase